MNSRADPRKGPDPVHRPGHAAGVASAAQPPVPPSTAWTPLRVAAFRAPGPAPRRRACPAIARKSPRTPRRGRRGPRLATRPRSTGHHSPRAPRALPDLTFHRSTYTDNSTGSHAELRRLAIAVREGGRALRTNRGELAEIVDDLAPGLTDRRGIGPVSAAQAIVSFSHPGRCRNDAAFAALADTNPLPASNGRTVRHRLNRGGRPSRCSSRPVSRTPAPRARFG